MIWTKNIFCVKNIFMHKILMLAMFRYRVYLENEDDEELHSEMETDNVSCGEWLDAADLLDPEAEEKENLAPASRPPSAPSSDTVNRTDPQVNRNTYSQ